MHWRNVRKSLAHMISQHGMLSCFMKNAWKIGLTSVKISQWYTDHFAKCDTAVCVADWHVSYMQPVCCILSSSNNDSDLRMPTNVIKWKTALIFRIEPFPQSDEQTARGISGSGRTGATGHFPQCIHCFATCCVQDAKTDTPVCTEQPHCW